MNEGRVYTEKIDINPEHTKSFFNDRAKKSDSMANPYTAVLLGDQSSDRANQWDRYEKSFLVSNVDFNKSDVILDIGCGMGRLAELLIPLCGQYIGADFSDEMIKLARKRCSQIDALKDCNYEFITASFSEVAARLVKFDKKITKLVVTGVSMYINDKELEKCYKNVVNLMNRSSLLYIEETVAIETRLTLDDIESASLKSNYDAIYRTPAEYNEFYKIFEASGYRKVDQAFFPNFDGKDEFKETDHWYTIFIRE